MRQAIPCFYPTSFPEDIEDCSKGAIKRLSCQISSNGNLGLMDNVMQEVDLKARVRALGMCPRRGGWIGQHLISLKILQETGN